MRLLRRCRREDYETKLASSSSRPNWVRNVSVLRSNLHCFVISHLLFGLRVFCFSRRGMFAGINGFIKYTSLHKNLKKYKYGSIFDPTEFSYNMVLLLGYNWQEDKDKGNPIVYILNPSCFIFPIVFI